MKRCVALLGCVALLAACQGPSNGAQVATPAPRPTVFGATPTPTAVVADTPTTGAADTPTATLAPSVLPSPTVFPTLGPMPADGRIYFLTVISTTQELAAINPDGSGYTVITHNLGGDVVAFAYSPDQTQIAVTVSLDRSAEPTVYLMNADGSDLRPLADSLRSEYSPTWSPDGTQLAFVIRTAGVDCIQACNQDIFRIGADGAGLRQLTVDPLPDLNPVWSPDGTHITFERGCVEITLIDCPHDLYTMAADGTQQTRIAAPRPLVHWPTLPDNTWRSDSVVAPDNIHIMFEVQVGMCGQGGTCSRQLYAARIGGAPPVQITSAGTWNALPAWSPDSHQLVFVSERDGESALYLMNADGSNQHCLTPVVSNYPVPQWLGAPKK